MRDTVIDGAAIQPVLAIGSADRVLLRGVSLTNGYARYGAVVSVDHNSGTSQATFDCCRIHGNRVPDWGFGSVSYLPATTLTRCLVYQNSDPAGSLLVYNTAAIINSTVWETVAA